MIFPFSFRNGYGNDLWPRPWTTVVLIVVAIVVVDDDEEEEEEDDKDDSVAAVVADFDKNPLPKIRSIENFNGDDLLVVEFDNVDEFIFSETIKKTWESKMKDAFIINLSIAWEFLNKVLVLKQNSFFLPLILMGH